MPLSPSTGDVKDYLKLRLDRDPEPEVMNAEFRVDIMGIVPVEISEMYCK